jgi:HD-GYP domain-containing protein (c-di-GMP phosphodiesterase class II)
MPLPRNFRSSLSGHDHFSDRLDDILFALWAAVPDPLGLRYLDDPSNALAHRELLLTVLASQTGEWDAYTAMHQSRVGVLAEAIALEMGLDPTISVLARAGGEVHDVGKNIIPIEVLTHPGDLAVDAHMVLGYHPLAGYEILTRAGFPEELAEVSLQHHEHLDGSGYPYGLCGDDISLPARIVAVADVLDAVSHARPYHDTLGLPIALEIIEAGSRTLYDPDVVSAALSLVSSSHAVGLRVL